MIGDVRVNALAPATPAFRIRATAARGAFTRDVSQQPSDLVVANAGVMRLGGQHHWVVIVNAEFNGYGPSANRYAVTPNGKIYSNVNPYTNA